MTYRRYPAFVCALFMAQLAQGADLDYGIHGFASQGFIYSQGNEVAPDSDDGTFKYYEAGLNGALRVGTRLSTSAQIVVRRFGTSDDGHLRIDYGFADYRAVDEVGYAAGVRAGRVRNPYGLFNETRGIIFTRPGILLPDSIYGDLSGQQRGFLFSSDGGQAYGRLDLGQHNLSLVVTASLNRRLDQDEKALLLNLGGLPFHVDAKDFWVARLMDEVGGNRWQFALSLLNLRLPFQTDSGAAVDVFGAAQVAGYVLSARYNAERFSVTAEYGVQNTESSLVIPGAASVTNASVWNDGAYIQADYRLDPRWTIMARIDAAAKDRLHRHGGNCQDGNGLPTDQHACFSIDTTAGLSWRPDEHWGIWGEVHVIEGYFDKFALTQNQTGSLDNHWGLVTLMAGYQF